MELRSITASELVVGERLPFSIYDSHGVLLLVAGTLLASESQRQILIAREAQCTLGEAPLRPKVTRGEADVKGRIVGAGPRPAAKGAPEPRHRPFPALRPPVQAIQVTLTGQGEPLRCAVDFVGFVPGGSLLVSTPQQYGRPVVLLEGAQLTVRLFAGKEIYFFPSRVLTICTKPFHYVHLELPDNVAVIDFRNHQRVQTRLDATVTSVSDGNLPATIVDLSISGARLEAARSVGGLGDRVEVNFVASVDGAGMPLAMQAVIRNTGAPSSSTGQFAGVEFVSVSLETKLALHALVAEAFTV